MKRIISMVMSILMIMTMFCGVLSVGSVAADVPADSYFAGYTSLAEANIVVKDTDTTDDIITVQLWVKDTSPNGFQELRLYFAWDESKVAPVTKSFTGTNNAYNEIRTADVSWNMYDVAGFAFDEGHSVKTQHLYTTYKEGRSTYLDEAYAVSIGSPQVFYVSSDTGFKSTYTYLDTAGYLDYYNATEEDGLLWGEVDFQIVEGATGSAVFEASFDTGAAITTGSKMESVAEYGLLIDDSVSYPVGEEEPEAPALPEGMTITVDKNASVRTTNTYEGIRFTTSVTVTDLAAWDEVAEMGTAIVTAGGTPTAEGFGDTTLKIPARVEYHQGKYIQERVDNANGTLTFTDGLLADAKAGTEIKFSGVISGLAANEVKYKQEFDAYAYVKLTNGTVIFSDNHHTSSLKTVCEKAMTDADLGNLTAEQAKVQALIDKYTAA